MTAGPYRASAAPAHSGDRVAAARRRAADDAADPQSAARLAGRHDRRAGVRRHRRHSARQPRYRRRHHHAGAADADAQPGAGGAALPAIRPRDLDASRATGRRFLPFIAGRLRVGPVEPNAGGRLKRLFSSAHSLPFRTRRAPGRGDAAACRCARYRTRACLVCAARRRPGARLPAGPYAVIHAAPMFRYKQWTVERLARAGGRALRARTDGGGDRRALPKQSGVISTVFGRAPVRARRDGMLDWAQLAGLLARRASISGPIRR